MNQMNRRLRLLLAATICLGAGIAAAQDYPERAPEFYRHELMFTNENDAYMFSKHDAFYTNGVFLKFLWAGERNGNKLTRSYELGQMIYTPLIRKSQSTADIDRPYCGYLFLKYHEANFLPKEAFLQYSASLGVVGPNSWGEGMQNSYHRLLGYGRFAGWQYQVQNAIGIDLGLSYARTLWEDSSWIKLVPAGQLNLGATFTNARIGMYTCLGIFEKNANSALWNARVQSKAVDTRKNYELFFYWYPQVIVQGYNATVEGGLLNKGNGAALGTTEPWMFQQNWGFCYAQGRWTTRVEFVYQTREAVDQKEAQKYGSIQVSYRMR
jgi:lipid A 3-O-deacylase